MSLVPGAISVRSEGPALFFVFVKACGAVARLALAQSGMSISLTTHAFRQDNLASCEDCR